MTELEARIIQASIDYQRAVANGDSEDAEQVLLSAVNRYLDNIVREGLAS